MKSSVIIFCFIAITAINLFAKETRSISSAKFESGYVEVDGGKLYYQSAGVGENIILIHDGLVHNVIWDQQFLEFAKTNHVVRYDRRGYGNSPVATAPFSNVEDLNQLFIQLNIEKAAVFGMSAGGGLAIDFTLKYPEKVNALVLVGAVVNGFPYTPHMTNRGGHFDFRSAKYLILDNFIQYFGWEDPYEVYPENIKAKETLLKVLKANPQNADGKKHRFEKQPERSAVKYLSEIKVPTLVIVGEFDIPDVHFHAGAITSGIPNARIQVVSKAAHLVPLEQPDVFNETALRFIRNSEFRAILDSKGVEAAAEYFIKYSEINPKVQIFSENEINNKGYDYLFSNRAKEAIKLFELNTLAFPSSSNAFDSQGEGYMTDGQNDLAIKSFEKALQLNPKNKNSLDQLKKLDSKTYQRISAELAKNKLNKPESVVFDKEHNRYLFSNYSTGDIVQIDKNGKHSILVENMNAIQGLEIVGNVVYVGAGTAVRGFDLTTGKMVMDVQVEGVSNLNDVTADENGNLYVGDVFGTKIIKIRLKDKSYSVFVEGKGIELPNGLFYDKTKKRILVCSFRENTPIQAISLTDSTVTTLAKTNLNNCDGIVLDKFGRCYVSSWETNSTYRFDKDFSQPPVVFYTNKVGQADISYDEVHNALIVPLMQADKYEIVSIDSPK